MNSVSKLLFAAALTAASLPAGEIPNARDRAFYVEGDAQLLGVQPDGRLLVLMNRGGEGAPTFRNTWGVGRLLPNGARDSSFASPLRLSSERFWFFQPDAVLQGDGKWLLAWNPSTGFPSGSRVVRLQTDGALDPGFVLDPALDTNFLVGPLAILPNGQILAQVSETIVRLDQSGALDSSFFAIWRNGDYSLALKTQADGRILVGGYHGNQVPALARYHPDGKPDTTFQPQFDEFAEVHLLIVQPDQKIVVSGLFQSINGVGRTNLARLHPDGAVDTSFYAPALEDKSRTGDSPPSELLLLADGRLLARSFWEDWIQLLRFESNGALDRVLLPLAGYHLTLQPDGQLLANALFTIFRYNLANIDKPGVMFAAEVPGRRPVQILESGGVLTNMILRLGATGGSLTVTFGARDGTAKAGENYVAQNRLLTFAPGETEKTVEVQIIDDTRPERDKDFFLQLSSGEDGRTFESQIRVVILQDDPGVFPTSPARTSWNGPIRELVFNARPGETWWLERSVDLKNWSRDGLSGNVDGSSGVRRPWQDEKAGLFPILFYRAVKE